MGILITGAQGFLGQHISKVWESEGQEVISLGTSRSNAIVCDLSNEVPNIPNTVEYVVHAAGKAHMVPKNKTEEKAFFDINLQGTLNLLKALGNLTIKPKGFLFISTVAVYGTETGDRIPETAPLLAEDPYGKSKKQAEDKIVQWGKEEGIPICIIRPPLIIGKNAPGNLKKMIQGIQKNRYANIAGGKARRSMVLAEDIARFSPTLVRSEGIYHLTDGKDPSFSELASLIGNNFSKKIRNIPYSLARLLALTGDAITGISGKEMPFSSNKLLKMTSNLTYDSTKARALGWNPREILTHREVWL
tara:strand:+ start:18394 stop:19305 length:912 start_codon:yes stop_codon:yes gene_type:complete